MKWNNLRFHLIKLLDDSNAHFHLHYKADVVLGSVVLFTLNSTKQGFLGIWRPGVAFGARGLCLVPREERRTIESTFNFFSICGLQVSSICDLREQQQNGWSATSTTILKVQNTDQIFQKTVFKTLSWDYTYLLSYKSLSSIPKL